MNCFFHIAYLFVKPLVCLLFPHKVVGLENLPEGGALLCANHASGWDPVLIAVSLPNDSRLSFMGKDSLFRIPLLGPIIRKLGAFPVKRGGNDLVAMKTAMKALTDGRRLLVFPEGTRVEHEGDLPAKGGVAVIGIRSGAQFVPVYVEGNKRIFRRTRIIFGQAYRPDAASRRPSPEEVQAIADEVLRRAYALGRET